MNQDASRVALIDETIRRRQTFKVLGDSTCPRAIAGAVAERNRPQVLEALRTAGWAPFHYDRGVDGQAEPWRAYLLWHERCRELAASFADWFPEAGATNKLPRMLAACGALALVTWLPQYREADSPTAAQQAVDDEHLAATAALVQNFLLALTARGMGTYWSSGGQLGSSVCFQRLGIPGGERLLAAVFIEFPEMQMESFERQPGKLREARGDSWMREITEFSA